MATACPKPSQGSGVMVETEYGAWPIAKLLVDLCEATGVKRLVNSVQAKFAILQSFSESMC